VLDSRGETDGRDVPCSPGNKDNHRHRNRGEIKVVFTLGAWTRDLRYTRADQIPVRTGVCHIR